MSFRLDVAVLQHVLWPMMPVGDVLNMSQCNSPSYDMIIYYRVKRNLTMQQILLYRSHHPLVASISLSNWRWLIHARLIASSPFQVVIDTPPALYDNDARILATALPLLTSLHTLAILNEFIDSNVAAALISGLRKNRSIERLQLRSNLLTADAQTILARELVHIASVHHVEFVDNQKSYATIHNTSPHVLLAPSSHVLSLSHNGIDQDAVDALAKALRYNTSLVKLDLHYCRLGRAGAKAIASALRLNTTLRQVDLRGNNIDDNGTAAIAEALLQNSCTALQELNLNVNPIGDGGARAIAVLLEHNTSLQTLGLCNNYIKNDGINAILSALRHNNNTLQQLDLTLNHFHNDLQNAIMAVMKNRLSNIPTASII